jgi:hypothetical protein
MRRDITEWLLWRPHLDVLPPLLSFLLLFVNPTIRNLDSLYAALSTLAGIVVATVTFTSSFVYGSDTKLMQVVRKKFGLAISSNVISMIVLTLLAAFLPLASMLIGTGAWGLILALASAIIVVEESLRCIFWIRYTLFMNDNSPRYESDGYDTSTAKKVVSQTPVREPNMRP